MRKLKFICDRKCGIFIIIFSLIISAGGIIGFGVNIIKEKTTKVIRVIRIPIPNPFLRYIKEIRLSESKKEIEAIQTPKKESVKFKVTAYDLSVTSTGKSRSNPAYGVSRGGTNLKDKTWDEARVIAVDPRIIPLGTSVLIEFDDDKYKIYNGVYLCNDTGSAIKGKKLDLFMGDYNSSRENKAISEFGITDAYVIILD